MQASLASPPQQGKEGRSVAVQTLDGTLSETASTIRLLRIVRADRRGMAATATAAPAAAPAAAQAAAGHPGPAGNAATGVEAAVEWRSREPSLGGRGGRARRLSGPLPAGSSVTGSGNDVTGLDKGSGRASAPEVSSPASSTEATPVQLPQPPPLRCPVGHGMQWFRERRREGGSGDSCAQTEACSVCSGTLTGPVGFHCCALCYHDQGERHAICGACSRDPAALDVYLARRHPLRKASSAVALQRKRQPPTEQWNGSSPGLSSSKSELLEVSRVREWSLVSAAAGKRVPR